VQAELTSNLSDSSYFVRAWLQPYGKCNADSPASAAEGPFPDTGLKVKGLLVHLWDSALDRVIFQGRGEAGKALPFGGALHFDP
jgi:hypothetical protein